MWSPDGQRLAYRSGCRGSVIVSDPSGNTVAEFLGDGWLVSWSPDSTRVATWVDVFSTIGVYGLDGVRQALLTVPSGCAPGGDFDPVWSPDGTSLVIPPCVVPVDGRAPRRVPAADPRSHLGAAWSRDGTRLAYIDYDTSQSLVIAKADGTKLRVLAGATNSDNGPVNGPAYQSPIVSPTGNRVAFIWSPVFYQTADPSSDSYELRLVDVASGTVTTLATATGASPLKPVAFSPEGDRILFSKTETNGVASLWSVKVDGSDARLLVTGTDWGDWQPLPDGP